MSNLTVRVNVYHTDPEKVERIERLICSALRAEELDFGLSGGFAFYRVEGQSEAVSHIDVRLDD